MRYKAHVNFLYTSDSQDAYLNMRNIVSLCILFLATLQFLDVLPSNFSCTSFDRLVEQFKQTGYVEICDHQHGAQTFEALYSYFDDLIEFLQQNPTWAQKLYCAKERFIRSNIRDFYSTDFFGFYDESKQASRRQISFYYSIHFHEFTCNLYPEFSNIPEIINFFKACFEIQQSCEQLFIEAADKLGFEMLFSSQYGQRPPILFKVVKYLPDYIATRPHYDGTVFSLFLDSTDNTSLLLSPYKSSLNPDDFSSPVRNIPRSNNQNSILLIPGTLLVEFAIDPTPHIVTPSGKKRYATIAFAMRPNHTSPKHTFTALPNFMHLALT